MTKRKVIRRTPEQVINHWLKALRSGKYKQTKKQLRGSDGGHCCLGVLCDLAAKDGGDQWNSMHHYGVENVLAFPPIEMTAYIGLSAGQRNSLASRNDGGATFFQIADRIEEMKPRLEKNRLKAARA